jgi:hypothetical protein
MELFNNLKRDYGGFVVEDEMISPRAKVVIGVHDTDDDLEIEQVDITKD